MELNGILNVIVGTVASLGGISLIKFLFFMKPEKRKARAEAELKELEADEKEMNVMKGLVESLKQRIEQQDEKIRQLNERVDWLYEEKHKLERENNNLVRENAMLKIQLIEAEYNLCVRPDDECTKRQPPRDRCTLKRFAQGHYDKYFTEEQLAEGKCECAEEDKKLFNKTNVKDENNGILEKSDKGRQP